MRTTETGPDTLAPIPSTKSYYACLTDPCMRPTALRVALVVGSILFTINHGSALINRSMTQSRWISAGLTYLVPYMVSIHGQRSATQRQQSQ